MKTKPKPAGTQFTESLGFRLLEHLPYGIMVADEHTSSFVYTNKRIQDLLGYSAEDLLGKTPDFVHPTAELDRVMMSYQAMLSGEEQVVSNIRFLTKSKQIVVCDIRAQLLHSNDQTFICGFITKSEHDQLLLETTDERATLKQRLNAAQEVGKMGFWTIFHDTGVLEWSDNTYRIFGFEPQSLQLSFDQLVSFAHPDDRQNLRDTFANHLAHRSQYDLMHRIVDAEGQVKYLRERCKTSFDATGKPIYSFGTVVDVTDLEQARLNAVRNLEQLQQILVNSRSFYWETDHEGFLENLSENASDLLGFERSTLLHHQWAEFVEVSAITDVSIFEGLLNGELEEIEDAYFPLRQSDGGIVWFNVRAKKRYTDAGGFLGYSGSASEVTRRKQAEEQLQESEARFRSIAETMPGAVWIGDLEFKIQYVSQGITRLTGFSEEVFIKQSRTDRYLQDDLNKVYAYIRKQKSALESGTWKSMQDERLEVRIKCADGGLKWVQITTKVLLDHLNQPQGYLGVITDISPLIGREEMLARLNAMLEAGGRMVQMGTWEYDLLNENLTWGKVTREIHEVADNFVPDIKNALQFYLPEDKEKIGAFITEIQTNGGMYDTELRLKTAKGNERWVRTMGQADFKDGVCERLWGVIIDIDNYKQKTIALEQEQLRLKNVISATKVATWYWNVQTGETIFDNRWAEMGGYTLEELAPISIKTWEMLCHPEDLELANQRLSAYFTGNSETYEAEFRLKHKSGKWIWVRDVGSVVEWTEDHRPLAMYGTHEDITATVELNKQLREKDERLRLITENLNEVFWLRDADNKSLLYLSPSAFSLFGISNEELQQQPEKWLDLVHPDDLHEVKRVLQSQKAGGSWEILFRLKRPNGSLAWIQSTSKAVFDENGTLVGHAGFSSDVSVRENLLHALEKAEQKYRIIAENNFNWEFWQLPTGEFAYHSPSSEVITGYKAEELLAFSDKLLELIHPDDRKAYHEHHTEVGCKRTDGHISFRIINKSGEVRYLEHICQPVFDDNGTYLGVRGTNIDVTEKKQAEQQLRKLWKVVEQSNASIVITNLKGDIEYVNPYFTQLTGYTKEEAIGKNPRILQSGHTTPGEYERMWKLLLDGQTWHGEFQNKKKNGELFWEAATISPVRDEQGKVVSYLAIKENITDRKLTEEKLRQSEEKYRLLAEHINDVIWVYNFNQLKFTYVSPSIFHLRGFSVEEALEERLEDSFSKADLEGIQTRFGLLMAMLMQEDAPLPDPVILEVRQPHKNGGLVWTEISIKFHRNEVGEMEALGVSRDIRERKTAENSRAEIREKLRESEARFKTLFYQNASAMYLVDAATGTFLDANEAALSFYGYKRTDFISKPLKEVNDDPNFYSKKLAYLKEHGQGRFEFSHTLADGSKVDVELFSSLLTLNGVLTIHEIVHDISDRNSYLNEIERQNTVLKEIAWTQSHVIRAPLARIMSLIELLEVEHASIYSEKLILDSLIQSARELDEMVHQINTRTQELHKGDTKN